MGKHRQQDADAEDLEALLAAANDVGGPALAQPLGVGRDEPHHDRGDRQEVDDPPGRNRVLVDRPELLDEERRDRVPEDVEGPIIEQLTATPSDSGKMPSEKRCVWPPPRLNPSVAPITNRSCQANGLKYQVWPVG